MDDMTETTAAPAGQPGPPPAPAPSATAPSSLRERKKLATRRSLRRIALDLVSQRGFANVTVEDIAAAADVSPRTFFNYFPSKEAALFGADPERDEELLRRLVEEAPGATALEALRTVIVDQARATSAEIAELSDDMAKWMRQMRAAQSDPHLRAARAAHMATVEYGIATALAERLGTDPERDPYPAVLASAAMAVMRTAFSFWPQVGGSVPLEQYADAACQALADGLPEDCALRTLAGPPPPPTPTDNAPHAPAAPAAGSEERTTAHVHA
jgi:AcrR family transcriptional regulator